MMLSRRRHAMLLIAIVVLEACLCTVNAAPWRRRKLPRKMQVLRKPMGRHHARASETTEEKTLFDSIFKQVPGNVIELAMVLSKMVFSPFNWQKDLCKNVWEKQNRRKTPPRDSIVISAGRLERFFDALKAAGDNIVAVFKLGFMVITNGNTWRYKYCDDAAESDD